jgi:outer membrane protein assembly factor BamB
MTTQLCIFTCLFTTSSVSFAADWLQFRGPNSSGVAPETQVPSKLEKKNIAWSTDLPGRGLSSPIVVGDRVFLTAADAPQQKRLHVICLNAKDGSLLWRRRFRATGRTMCHPKTNVAAPSLASDGRRLFALYSSNDLICLDLDGNLLWMRGLTWDYPNASNSLGLASSPVVAGNTLVVQSENDSNSFAAGIEIKNGKNQWKIARPKAANWTSPVLLDETSVALQSSAGVHVVEAATGKKKWHYRDGASTIPTLAAANGVLYVPSQGITALRPGGNGVKQLWRSNQLSPSTASPIVLGDHIFTVNRTGVLTCATIKDGKRTWQLRLKGPFSASPVATGNYIYFVNEKGLVQVVDVSGTKGVLASTMGLGEPVLSTPAISGAAVYVRSNAHVWKLARK